MGVQKHWPSSAETGALYGTILYIFYGVQNQLLSILYIFITTDTS